MENFTIGIVQVINTFNNELFKMININVRIINGKFPIRALEEYVSVTDGNTRVSCFMANISGNQKEINASFTTNAFTIFSGNVNIEFGYGNEIMGVFENFDIHNNILPLNPIFADVNAPNADNAWLQNILDTQDQ